MPHVIGMDRLRHQPFCTASVQFVVSRSPPNLLLNCRRTTSIMEAYNIGENLEFLRLVSDPNYEIFLRTPKLKKLRMIDLVPFPPDVCAILETIHYFRGFSYMEIEGEAIKLDCSVRYIFFSDSNLPETTLQIQSREDFPTFHCPE
jgi:hypothetical protein